MAALQRSGNIAVICAEHKSSTSPADLTASLTVSLRDAEGYEEQQD